MALLKLLAGAAPARVVAADLLGVVEATGLDDRERAGHLVRGHLGCLGHARGHGGAGGGGDRVATGEPVAAGLLEATRLRTVGAEAPTRPATLWRSGLLLRLLDLDLDVEHVSRELVPDVVHEPSEHVEALVLV